MNISASPGEGETTTPTVAGPERGRLDAGQRLRVLQQSALLRDADPGFLRRLASRAREQEYGAGAVLYRVGESPRDLYVLIQGRVRHPQIAGEAGGGVVPEVRAPGQVFGFAAAMEGSPLRLISAECLEPTRVLAVPRAEFQRLCREFPDAGAAVMQRLVGVFTTYETLVGVPDVGTGTASFAPEARAAAVPRGTWLIDAAAQAGTYIEAPCGDRGKCLKCKVQVTGVASGLTEAEVRGLTTGEIERRWRLACQVFVHGDVGVRVPRSTVQMALAGKGRALPLQPNVQKVALVLERPTVDDLRSPHRRLTEGLGLPGLRIDLDAVRALVTATKTASRVTAALVGSECVDVEAGDTTTAMYGVALDLGTTTVVATLVDLATGEALALATSLNEQIMYGADLISRLAYAIQEPHGLGRLHETVVGLVNRLIGELTEKAAVAPRNIYELVLVGNSGMHHLFLGIDPTPLALAPYVPALEAPLEVKARDLGITVHPAAAVRFLPIVAGFVGADAVGVALATGIHHSRTIKLIIDLGTNGEIILGSKRRLMACSAPAGPAFEAAQMSCGMRAATGAIERVRFTDDLEVDVIGGGPAQGICGSGVIEAVLALCRAGLVAPSGKLLTPEEAAGRVLPALLARVGDNEHGRVVRLGGDADRPVFLSQKDIRELQVAKGATRTGVEILKKAMGISDDDIDEVYLAGSFGTYVSAESAAAIGLVPGGLRDRITSIGNAAAAGARMALCSLQARQEAVELAARMEHVLLADRPDFADEFMAAMHFADVGTGA